MKNFLLSRMNDFQRLCDLEPWNYTAFDAVRLCADLFFRLEVPIFKQGNTWRIVE